ncbi:MAG: 3'-5' exonuclease [Sulfurovaceae bacterium]|nr:3'-5' exonuclease [Sulfurovaceae bacterium]
MKIAYIDTETTGLDAKKHGIVQLACLIVEDHKIIDEIDLLIDPFSYKENCVCDDKALEINGRTLEEIEHFPNSDDQLQKFVDFLSNHTVEDKLQVSGYNVDFDIGFIKDWFSSCDGKFSDFFNYKTLDVLSLVRHIEYMDITDFDSHSLSDACAYFEIPLIAHDALNDIKATYRLHEEIISFLSSGFSIDRRCRVCGCTDDHACIGGCYWVEIDLCCNCTGGIE